MNNSTLDSLFRKSDSASCSLLDYVSTFTDPLSGAYNKIQLPPIQRNAVWNTAQVERLWDSILRGFPIGSFLLAPREPGDASRRIYDSTLKKSTENGYFLLDGQQRTRAILLGFKANENARLWIDLNPNMPFGNPDQNDRKFLLRVISSYQPWGMDDRVPSNKLHENQKNAARERLRKEKVRYDYKVKINTGPSNDLEYDFSWPIMAVLPIPLDELVQLCGGVTGVFREPSWSEVLNLIPVRYKDDISFPEQPTEHYQKILEALRKLLDTHSEDVRLRNVILLYQNAKKQELADYEIDPMEVLFTRVNAGGTVLNGEEMAYSLLKSSWDGAYTMVSKIVNSEKVGYLLPPTGVVMAASRLARHLLKKNDDPNPSVSNFRKWIREQQEEKTFLGQIKLLLDSPNEESPFYKVIESFCHLALYRETFPGDVGIPKKLLLSIKAPLFHPAFLWIYENRDNKGLLEQNRLCIIQYLILSYLTIDGTNAGKASKIAFKLLEDRQGFNFPSREIHKALVEAELACDVPNPEEFLQPFRDECDGFFRKWEDIFSVSEDPFNSFRLKFWGKRELLLWFQRDYAAKWFDGYNPMSDDAYDTPYDYDHILPYSHLVSSGNNNNVFDADQSLVSRFQHSRYHYINSIGNFRIWPAWANRSDNNKCHTSKLRIDQDDLSNDPVATELLLPTSDEFLSASAINISDMVLWNAAGGKPKNWPSARRVSFQKAVENRVANLYTTLYEAIFNLKGSTTEAKPATSFIEEKFFQV